MFRLPSIHQVGIAIDPALGPTSASGDHFRPPKEEVKNSWPGCTVNVVGLRWWPQTSASMRPLGWTSTDPSYPPPAGKPGCILVIGPQVLPELVDFWTTALASTAL